LVAPLASAASSKQHCGTSCKQETRACEQTRCTGLHGSARRSCLETCKGIGGCAPLRTLAYEVLECDEDSRGIVDAEIPGEILKVRRGNCDPVTIFEHAGGPSQDPLPGGGACRDLGTVRYSPDFVLSGGVQRLGVSPDGSGVAFEVNNHVALFPVVQTQEGFFFVRADGSGLRC